MDIIDADLGISDLRCDGFLRSLLSRADDEDEMVFAGMLIASAGA